MNNVTLRLDVTQLPFRIGTFDFVIANHILEHITHDWLAITELNRVLRTSGTAILQVPISWRLKNTIEDPSASPEEKLARFGQRDHVRIYGRDYLSRLEAGGFTVEVYDVASDLGCDVVSRYGLFPGEHLIVATKQE